MRSPLALVVLLVLGAPALASGPYVEHGTIGATSTPYLAGPLDKWSFDVVPGDLLTATLAWDAPDANLALEVVPPQTSCGNEGCFTTIPEYSSCETIDNGVEPRARSVTVVATEEGLASVFVSTLVSDETVAYTLTFAVNGEAPVIQFRTDEGSTTPHRQHVCHLEGKL